MRPGGFASIPVPLWPKWPWARSSAGEHYVDIVGVTGSIPVAPTIKIKDLEKTRGPAKSPGHSGDTRAGDFLAIAGRSRLGVYVRSDVFRHARVAPSGAMRWRWSRSISHGRGGAAILPGVVEVQRSGPIMLIGWVFRCCRYARLRPPVWLGGWKIISLFYVTRPKVTNIYCGTGGRVIDVLTPRS